MRTPNLISKLLNLKHDLPSKIITNLFNKVHQIIEYFFNQLKFLYKQVVREDICLHTVQ